MSTKETCVLKHRTSSPHFFLWRFLLLLSSSLESLDVSLLDDDEDELLEESDEESDESRRFFFFSSPFPDFLGSSSSRREDFLLFSSSCRLRSDEVGRRTSVDPLSPPEELWEEWRRRLLSPDGSSRREDEGATVGH